MNAGPEFHSARSAYNFLLSPNPGDIGPAYVFVEEGKSLLSPQSPCSYSAASVWWVSCGEHIANAAWFNVNSTIPPNTPDPCSWKPRYLIQASNVTSRNTRPVSLPARPSLLLSTVNRPSHPPAKPMIPDSPFIQPTKKIPLAAGFMLFSSRSRILPRSGDPGLEKNMVERVPRLAGSLPRQPRFRTGDAVPHTGVKAGRTQPLPPGAPGGWTWLFRATPPRGRGHPLRGF